MTGYLLGKLAFVAFINLLAKTSCFFVWLFFGARSVLLLLQCSQQAGHAESLPAETEPHGG